MIVYILEDTYGYLWLLSHPIESNKTNKTGNLAMCGSLVFFSLWSSHYFFSCMVLKRNQWTCIWSVNLSSWETWTAPATKTYIKRICHFWASLLSWTLPWSSPSIILFLVLHYTHIYEIFFIKVNALLFQETKCFF